MRIDNEARKSASWDLGSQGEGQVVQFQGSSQPLEICSLLGRSTGSKDGNSFQHKKGSFGKYSKGLMLIISGTFILEQSSDERILQSNRFQPFAPNTSQKNPEKTVYLLHILNRQLQ